MAMEEDRTLKNPYYQTQTDTLRTTANIIVLLVTLSYFSQRSVYVMYVCLSSLISLFNL